MMRWGLREGVHAVLTGRDLILLDLRDDAYVCLRAAAPETPPEARPGSRPAPLDLAALDGEALDALRDGGFLALDRRAPPAAPPPPAATRDLRDHAPVRPTLSDLFAALGALGDLRRAGPDAPMSRLLSLAGPPGAPPGPSDPAVLAAARRFADLLPWLPWSGACLTRSALLAAFLRRRGLRADWIVAVRAWPFRAHCWLQSGDVCLNDDAERLRAYAPLLKA